MKQQERLSVIKIGGNVIDKPMALERFLFDFNQIKGRKILVHGGGTMASDMATQLGIATKMVDGRRITDYATLKVVTMVYAGWINKNIVAQLQKMNCHAIGLSGADANCIPAVKRIAQPIDFGYVGDPNPDAVNVDFIIRLLAHENVPVFCAITHDNQGSLLNTNADTIAYSLAVALSRNYHTTLYYCFEKEGVLRDINDTDSLLPEITSTQYSALKAEGVISGGMIPKLDNAFAAIAKGVAEVFILHAENLLTKKGTKLTSQ